MTEHRERKPGPPRPPNADRIRYRYSKSGRTWYGTITIGYGMLEPGTFALTERAMRRKLARFIRKQRRLREQRERTAVAS